MDLKKLHLNIITGKTYFENLASINILKKIGMKFQGDETEDGCPIKVFAASNPYSIAKSTSQIY